MSVTLEELKIHLGVPITDTSNDAALQQMLRQSLAIASRVTRRDFALTDIEERLDGQNTSNLVLRRKPVVCVNEVRLSRSTCVVQGAAVTKYRIGSGDCVPAIDSGYTTFYVEGVGLFALVDGRWVEQPFDCNSDLPVNEGFGQGVRLPKANENFVRFLVFGEGLFSLSDGIWKQEPHSGVLASDLQSVPARFDDDTILTPGVDYELKGQVIRRLGGLWWPARQESPFGLVAWTERPGQGNILVRYVAGSVAMPEDIKLGVMQVAALVLNSASDGGRRSASESLDYYSISYETSSSSGGGLASSFNMDDARSIFGAYRTPLL